jgi:hypothetical protein
VIVSPSGLGNYKIVDTGTLCADLHRFVFLLGGNDGEELFGEPAQ